MSKDTPEVGDVWIITAYFAEELTPINAQKFEYYLLGLITAEFFMRITKDD